MSINGMSCNPYLYMGEKAELNLNNNLNKNYGLCLLNNGSADIFTFNGNTKIAIETAKENLYETKTQQGLIGTLWDGFKNLTGLGASSKKAKKQLRTLKTAKSQKKRCKKE